MNVNITMARKGDGRCPIIGRGVISLGQLIYYGAYILPGDPVWTVETIGL